MVPGSGGPEVSLPLQAWWRQWTRRGLHGERVLMCFSLRALSTLILSVICCCVPFRKPKMATPTKVLLFLARTNRTLTVFELHVNTPLVRGALVYCHQTKFRFRTSTDIMTWKHCRSNLDTFGLAFHQETARENKAESVCKTSGFPFTHFELQSTKKYSFIQHLGQNHLMWLFRRCKISWPKNYTTVEENHQLITYSYLRKMQKT